MSSRARVRLLPSWLCSSAGPSTNRRSIGSTSKPASTWRPLKPAPSQGSLGHRRIKIYNPGWRGRGGCAASSAACHASAVSADWRGGRPELARGPHLPLEGRPLCRCIDQKRRHHESDPQCPRPRMPPCAARTIQGASWGPRSRRRSTSRSHHIAARPPTWTPAARSASSSRVARAPYIAQPASASVLAAATP